MHEAVPRLRRPDVGDDQVSRPRENHDQRVTTAVRLPADLHERLKATARERDVSANYMVVRAVEEFLERLIPVDELRRTR